jgi:serine/threonine protein kinase
LRDAIQFQHIRIRVAVSWATQFCDAMNFAMKLGLQSHRDIKPENLLIDQNGVLKVTDFGMASMVGEEGHRGGTLPYMAPEQFSLDSRLIIDIYAFGVILYELVSGGKYPYIIPPGSRDLFRTYAEIHRNAEVRIQQTPLNQIVKKCMQKNPAKRYQTFGAFRSDILKIAKKYNLALMPVPRTSADEAYRGRYAKALVYRENGKLKECTALLRELQKEDPTDPRISNELKALRLWGYLHFSGQKEPYGNF